MARKIKAAGIGVEIELWKDQFNKDLKATAAGAKKERDNLNLDMQRNKVQLQMDIAKLDSSSIIGKTKAIRLEMDSLTKSIEAQRKKIIESNKEFIAVSQLKGPGSKQAITAEYANLRDQAALATLIGQQKTLRTEAKNAGVGLAGMFSVATKGALVAGAAGAALGTGIVIGAKNWGEAVAEIMDQTGATGEEASKLLIIGKKTGAGVEEQTSSMVKFGKAISLAKDSMAAAAAQGKTSDDMFTRMGMTFDDLSNKSMYEIFQKTTEFMRGMGDAADLDRVAMDLFGRSGWQLHDMLVATTADQAKWIEAARSSGLILSGETAEGWKQFDRQLKSLEGTAGRLAISIGNELLPSLQKLLDSATETTKAWASLDKTERENIANQITMAAEIAAVVGGMLAAAKAAGILKGALALLAANPVIAITVSVAYLVGSLAKARKDITPSEIPIDLMDNFGGVGTRNRGDKPVGNAGNGMTDYEKLDRKQSNETLAALQEQNSKKDAEDKKLAAANLKTAEELANALGVIRGNTLDANLKAIQRQVDEFRKAKLSEVEINKFAEEAKTKAVKDQVLARFGPEVAAAKKALDEGTNVGDAIAKAKEARMKDEKNTYEAIQAVKRAEGIYAPGDEIRKLNINRETNTITQLTEIAKTPIIPRDANGRSVLDSYAPAPSRPVYTDENGNRTNGIPQGQPGSIMITVPVSIDGQKVGEAAAKVILPPVQAAINQPKTNFGGNNQ